MKNKGWTYEVFLLQQYIQLLQQYSCPKFRRTRYLLREISTGILALCVEVPKYWKFWVLPIPILKSKVLAIPQGNKCRSYGYGSKSDFEELVWALIPIHKSTKHLLYSFLQLQSFFPRAAVLIPQFFTSWEKLLSFALISPLHKHFRSLNKVPHQMALVKNRQRQKIEFGFRVTTSPHLS